MPDPTRDSIEAIALAHFELLKLCDRVTLTTVAAFGPKDDSDDHAPPPEAFFQIVGSCPDSMRWDKHRPGLDILDVRYDLECLTPALMPGLRTFSAYGRSFLSDGSFQHGDNGWIATAFTNLPAVARRLRNLGYFVKDLPCPNSIRP